MTGPVPAAPAASRPAPSARHTFTTAYQGAGGSTRPTRTDSIAAAGRGAARADNAAGFVLGLLFWGWVALPFLKSGPTGVKDTLRAKFFNKAADGSWLP